MGEGLRFPLFEISQKCINGRLRGETEVKLRKIDEEIRKIEEEVENANRTVVLRFVSEMKEYFEEVKFYSGKFDDQSVKKIIESCEELERRAYDLKTLLRTYIIRDEK